MIGVEVNPGCYALHQVQDGWEIIAPSDDPYAPAYWRVGVVRQYGWREAGRDRDGNAPVSWGGERGCVAWSSASVQPANHVAISHRSQSPREKDRTAR